jgi:CTP synthase
MTAISRENRQPQEPPTVDIAAVGKYVDYGTPQVLNEALAHGGIANAVKVNLRYVDSETEND